MVDWFERRREAGGSRRPGRIMSGETAERPGVPRRILGRGAPVIREDAAEIAAKRPRSVLLGARGTSGNAALHAKCLLEIRPGLPRGLASMSTTTAYGAEPDPREGGAADPGDPAAADAGL